MSEISQRYERLASEFGATVAAVPPARWSQPSPCEGWDARDVVKHVVGAHAMQLGFIGHEVREVPSVDDDPVAAFHAASTAVQVVLDEPQQARQTFDGVAGPTTFEDSIDQFLSFDLVVHRWDLAKAAGLDTRLNPDDVAWVAAGASAMGEGLRADGVCGPALTPPDDADAQTRMLAYLGRRA